MEEKDSLLSLRHTTSHILAQAVLRLWPETKLGIGPATESGFYYDFDFSSPVSEDAFLKIEKEMKKIIKEGLPITKKEVDIKKVQEFFKNQPYKLELLEDFKKEGVKKVTLFSQGDFTDLCQGPHLQNTNKVGVFSLLSVAGAYWKGSEKNKMLTRIYGTAFFSQKKLEEYLKKLEEAQRRDHRRLGQKLKFFILPPEIGGGLPIWLPKGALLRQIIEDFWKKEHQKEGYLYVFTPHIAHSQLWKTSGHLQFYKENMYSEIEIDDEKYLLKPMNCPFHIFVYKNEMRSYKDLPLKLCELGAVYRYERSGTLLGLTRVRGFTQDDAHIFTTQENLQKEIEEILGFALRILRKFGFEKYEIDFSIRDSKNKKKYLGDEKIWQKSEESLEDSLKKYNLNYKKAEGEAVFYGPKIDIKIKDALDRPWQCTTIQVDFNLPEKFNLFYIDKKGKKRKPVLIHRTILGSLERFIGVLLEHWEGNLPLWLAPLQVKIINVGTPHKEYAKKVAQRLKENNIRCELDLENKTVSKKILEAVKEKIPYIVVIGEKETQRKTLNIRNRAGKTKEEKIEKFIEKLNKELRF